MCIVSQMCFALFDLRQLLNCVPRAQPPREEIKAERGRGRESGGHSDVDDDGALTGSTHGVA